MGEFRGLLNFSPGVSRCVTMSAEATNSEHRPHVWIQWPAATAEHKLHLEVMGIIKQGFIL